MANFFDQFDEQQPETQGAVNPNQTSNQQANFFDQFDEQPEQQAGGAVEESAKGLLQAGVNILNIPGSLVNTALSAVGVPPEYQVMTPDLPDSLKPKDTYAQIGSEVLPYLLPVGGQARAAEAVANSGRAMQTGQKIASLAALSLPGALAANSQSGNTDKLAQDVGLGIAAGGVVNAIGKGIGAAYRGVKGTIAPEAQALINAADDANVPLMTSDAIRPTTKPEMLMQNYSESVPLGTAPLRATQQEAREQLVKRFTERFGEYDPSVVVNSAVRGVKAEKDLARLPLGRISSSMTGKPIDTTGTIRAIDGAINDLSKLKDAADDQTISALQKYKSAIQGTSQGDDAFSLLDKLRTQFRIDVKGDRQFLPSGSQSVIDRVYNAMGNSLTKSIGKELGPKESALWRKGKSDYAQMAVGATQTKLKNVLEKGALTPETVNAIVYGQTGSEIKRLFGKLDSRGKDMMRAAYISRIAEKADGSPEKLISGINRLSKQANGDVFKTVFSGKHKKEISGLMDVLNATNRAAKANVVNPNGMTISTPLRVIGNLGTSGGLMAAEGGIGLLSRVYESPAVRNTLLRLANTPKNSPAYERALDAAIRATNAITQGATE